MPTDIDKVTEKYVGILQNYDRLTTIIKQYESDAKSYLEGVQIKLDNLSEVGHRILRSHNCRSLIKPDDIEKLKRIDNDFKSLYEEIERAVMQEYEQIESSKSVEQCSDSCVKYRKRKRECEKKIGDMVIFIDEMVDVLKTESVSRMAELGREKNDAIKILEAEAETFHIRLQVLIQTVYDITDHLPHKKTKSDTFEKRLNKYTLCNSEMMKLLETTRGQISKCTMKEQIDESISAFREKLKDIEMEIDFSGREKQ